MPNRNFDALSRMTLEYGEKYGLDHSLRIIALVQRLARGRSYNEDVIAFCAFVHDFGGYSKFLEAGKDHAARSTEILPQFMALYDFADTEKNLIVETVAQHHSKEVPQSFEAALFRDADALDFLGYIGIARNLMRFGKDMQKAIDAIQRHRAALPGMLHEEEAQEIAKTRIEEMDSFLSGLHAEHYTLFSQPPHAI